MKRLAIRASGVAGAWLAATMGCTHFGVSDPGATGLTGEAGAAVADGGSPADGELCPFPGFVVDAGTLCDDFDHDVTTTFWQRDLTKDPGYTGSVGTADDPTAPSPPRSLRAVIPAAEHGATSQLVFQSPSGFKGVTCTLRIDATKVPNGVDVDLVGLDVAHAPLYRHIAVAVTTQRTLLARVYDFDTTDGSGTELVHSETTIPLQDRWADLAVALGPDMASMTYDGVPSLAATDLTAAAATFVQVRLGPGTGNAIVGSTEVAYDDVRCTLSR